MIENISSKPKTIQDEQTFAGGFYWAAHLLQKKIVRHKRHWAITLLVAGIALALGVTFTAILMAGVFDNLFS